MDIKNANEFLNSLIDEQLLYVTRCCELVNIGFGKYVSQKNSKGEIFNVASHSIHILAPFRILKNNSIILGSNDLFLPKNGGYGVVDLNKKNSCKFDVIAAQNQNVFSNEFVKSININALFDLSICLSDILIQIFNDKSDTDESWRFFKTNSEEPHLVVYGNSIELN